MQKKVFASGCITVTLYNLSTVKAHLTTSQSLSGFSYDNGIGDETMIYTNTLMNNGNNENS